MPGVCCARILGLALFMKTVVTVLIVNAVGLDSLGESNQLVLCHPGCDSYQMESHALLPVCRLGCGERIACAKGISLFALDMFLNSYH